MKTSATLFEEIAELKLHLDKLSAQYRAALLRESAIPFGVGSRVSHKGSEFEVHRLDPAFAGAVQIYGRKIKKDGTPGASAQYLTLWSNGEAVTGPFEVLEAL